MRCDIFARFELLLVHEREGWAAYRVEDGKRRPASDVFIPADTAPEAMKTHLADLLHELAQPCKPVRRLH
jgi:hypothetical protein